MSTPTVQEKLNGLSSGMRQVLALFKPGETPSAAMRAKIGEFTSAAIADYESVVSDARATLDQVKAARACAETLGGLSPDTARMIERAFPLRRGKLAERDAKDAAIRALRGER